jgi:Mg2+ and Co2+ transporter CorA
MNTTFLLRFSQVSRHKWLKLIALRVQKVFWHGPCFWQNGLMSTELAPITKDTARTGELSPAATAPAPNALISALAASAKARRKLGRFLSFLLGEACLGFLAIVAAGLTVVPMLFKVSAHGEKLLEACQWVIILLFAVEYGLALAAADSKRKFVLNPWRIVDAATILVPLATFVPGVSDLLRSSPVLRLVRLARLLTLGVRASGVMVRETKAVAAPVRVGPVQVHMLPGLGATAPRLTTWDEFLRWAKQPQAGWYSITNVDEHNLPELELATGIPADFICSHLFGAGYPHLERTDRFISLFVWVPQTTAAQTTERNGVLLFANDKGVLTFSRRPTHVLQKIAEHHETELASLPFPARMTCQFLDVLLDINENLIGHFEQKLAELEELPVRESRPQFFEGTFRLKKELSAAQSDLWRLRGVLKDLADSRVKFPGTDAGPIEFLAELAEKADYLYETVNNTREGVLSLIDLHLNVVSFEMNRVMRVLAVVSVLGLIPAVVGGLFGMNLADNPWPFTLPQVTFAVGMTMVVCLYLFVVKGWLR